MATIVVVGAQSQLGAQIAARLHAAGHGLRLVASHAATQPFDTSHQHAVTVLESPTPDTCEALLDGADVVVIAATTARPMWVRAAVARHCPLVDCASEQHELAEVWDELAALPCVLGAGLVPGLADLLVNATLDRMTPAVSAVSTAFTWPDRNFPPVSFRGTKGRRRSVAGTLIHPGMRQVEGKAVDEEIGERRKPVWFPRPVGPQFALAWPSVSWFTLQQRISGLATSEHFVVVGGWRSEVLQALSNVAHSARGARWLTARAATSVRNREPSLLRWACVAEVHAKGVFWRAWAYGHDPYAVSAATAATAVTALLDGHIHTRQSFATLAHPVNLLDDLTAVCGLRWSVSAPLAHG